MSKFSLRPFVAKDILPLIDEPINVDHRAIFREGGLAEMAEVQGSFTGVVDGKVMVCGGISVYWPGRAHLWTMFSECSKENFVPVFRGIKRFLKEQLEIHRRIEVSIPCDFTVGRRRAELLGFKLETAFAESYFSTGKDAAIYVMVSREKAEVNKTNV